MKVIFTIFLILFVFGLSFGEDFIRDLPDENMANYLTPDRFKNLDAVIILKEQSYKIEPTEQFYRGYELKGPTTSYTKIVIAKLFTESAVKRYGSFEYEYNEQYGDELPNFFEARARVLKPNGDIFEVNEDEIEKFISRETSRGRPLSRKVLFKIPNLAVNDIVQIEYTFNRIFTYSTSNVFYYNDRDFILYSNLYITLPSNMDASYLNFSEERIGKPKIEQMSGVFGSGETYFWGLKNLYPIPDEPFSFPFADQSLMTAFVVKKMDYWNTGTWEEITEDFYDNYLEDDKIDKEKLDYLGLEENIKKTTFTFEKTDTVYKHIREKLNLKSFNSLIPQSDDIASIFEKKEGDASDLAYIMYKILEQWGVSTNIVWIRDKREGIYELTVPSSVWFDRLGVLVRIEGKEKIYDFDRSVPLNYSVPWYLKGQNVVVIKKKGYEHKKISDNSNINANVYFENHVMSFDSLLNLNDRIQLQYSGIPAEDFRDRNYVFSKKQVQNKISDKIKSYNLECCDSLTLNEYISESDVNIDICGKSIVKPEEVDSFLVFKIKNKTIQELFDDISSTTRMSNYSFKQPFKIYVVWEMEIPDGYTLQEQYPDKMFPPVEQISAKIMRSVFSNKFTVTANIKFNNSYLSYKKHTQLMKLFQDLQKELDRDIILKKI